MAALSETAEMIFALDCFESLSLQCACMALVVFEVGSLSKVMTNLNQMALDLLDDSRSSVGETKR